MMRGVWWGISEGLGSQWGGGWCLVGGERGLLWCRVLLGCPGTQSFPTPPRGELVLGAPVRQHVLPAGGPASLHGHPCQPWLPPAPGDTGGKDVVGRDKGREGDGNNDGGGDGMGQG